MNELKNLQATGLSTLGTSLKEAFDLLNLYRLHSGIDNYGMVREFFILTVLNKLIFQKVVSICMMLIPEIHPFEMQIETYFQCMILAVISVT